jgi:hypothetical protein
MDGKRFEALMNQIDSSDKDYLKNRYESNNLVKQILQESNKKKRDEIIGEYLNNLKEIAPDKVSEMIANDFGGNTDIQKEIEECLERSSNRLSIAPILK